MGDVLRFGVILFWTNLVFPTLLWTQNERQVDAMSAKVIVFASCWIIYKKAQDEKEKSQKWSVRVVPNKDYVIFNFNFQLAWTEGTPRKLMNYISGWVHGGFSKKTGVRLSNLCKTDLAWKWVTLSRRQELLAKSWRWTTLLSYVLSPSAVGTGFLVNADNGLHIPQPLNSDSCPHLSRGIAGFSFRSEPH